MARPSRTLVRFALRCGIAVPIIYYGAQVIAAPFYPDYSLRAHEASLLGSDSSRLPIIFNAAALLSAVAMAVAAWAYLDGLGRLGVGRVATYLAMATILSGAVGSLNAGLFPLPDPRHGSGPLIGLSAGFFFLPIVLLIAFWKPIESRPMRWYLAANLVFFALFLVAMAPGVGGEPFQEVLSENRGLVQRLSAATVFVPIGVCSYVLLRALQSEAEGDDAIKRA